MEILEGFKDVEIVYCKSCKKIFYRHKCIPVKEFKKAFNKYIKSFVRFNVEPEEFHADASVLDKLDESSKEGEVAIRVVSGYYDEEAVIPVLFRKIECAVCSRLKGGYYEGILQLRNEKSEMFGECKSEIEQSVHLREQVSITNKKKVKGGVDYYITDKKYLRSLSSNLHQKYGGELKISPHLHTTDRQSSKHVYRLNVLLRLPEFNVDDIIKSNGYYYKIASFSSDKVYGNNLEDGKSKPINMKDAERVAQRSDFKEVVVTKRKPHVEILHPVSYESVPVENNPEIKGRKVRIIILDDRVFAV